MLKNQKGSTLIMILMVFSVVSILGVVTLSRALYSQNESLQEVEGQKAYYLAKSALDAAISYIENFDSTTQSSHIMSSLSSQQKVKSKETKVLDRGSYYIQIEKKSDDNQEIIVTGYGTYGNSTRKISAVLEVVKQGGGGNSNIAFAAESIQIRNAIVEGDVYSANKDQLIIDNSKIKGTLYADEGYNSQDAQITNSEIKELFMENANSVDIKDRSKIDDIKLVAKGYIHIYNNCEIGKLEAQTTGNIEITNGTKVDRTKAQATGNITVNGTEMGDLQVEVGQSMQITGQSKINTVQAQVKQNVIIENNEVIKSVAFTSDTPSMVKIANNHLEYIRAYMKQQCEFYFQGNTYSDQQNHTLIRLNQPYLEGWRIDANQKMDQLVIKGITELGSMNLSENRTIQTLYTDAIRVANEGSPYILALHKEIPLDLENELENQLDMDINIDIDSSQFEEVKKILEDKTGWKVPNEWEKIEYPYQPFTEYVNGEEGIHLIYTTLGANITIKRGDQTPNNWTYYLPYSNEDTFIFIGGNTLFNFNSTDEVKNVHIYAPNSYCHMQTLPALFMGNIIAQSIIIGQQSDGNPPTAVFKALEVGSDSEGEGDVVKEKYVFKKYKSHE